MSMRFSPKFEHESYETKALGLDKEIDPEEEYPRESIKDDSNTQWMVFGADPDSYEFEGTRTMTGHQ